MRVPMIGILVLMSLTGCQARGLNAPPPLQGAGSSLRLGALEFRPLSAEAAQALAARQQGAARAEATGAAAPMAADAKLATSRPYDFAGYFGGPFGQMELEGVTEAQAPGAIGGFAAIVKQVVAPAVAEWSADARLIESYGNLDETGAAAAKLGEFQPEPGWHLVYAAPSRLEVLRFTVTPEATRVVRMRWTPVQLDADAVQVDAADAIARLTAAIRDPSARSKEEELGHDYFFGAGGGNTVGIAVPAVAVATRPRAVLSAPQTTPAGTLGDPIAMPPLAPLAPPEPYAPPGEETLYALTPGGAWSARLTAVAKHLVWDLSYQPVQPMAVTEGQPWVDAFAFGMVDARSGELIRFRRPVRYTPSTAPVAKPTPEAVSAVAR